MSNLPRLNDEGSSLPYYHTDFREYAEVEERILQLSRGQGSFLLRPSFTSQSYTLTILKNDIYNIKIKTNGSGQYLLNSPSFNTIQELVDYYKSVDLPNRENITGIRLLYPIHHRRDSCPVVGRAGNLSRMNGNTLNNGAPVSQPPSRPLPVPNSSKEVPRFDRSGSLPVTGGRTRRNIALPRQDSRDVIRPTQPALPITPEHTSSVLSKFFRGKRSSQNKSFNSASTMCYGRAPGRSSSGTNSSGSNISNCNCIEVCMCDLNERTTIDIANRPAMPIPQLPQDPSHYYTTPNDVTIDKAEALVNFLEQFELEENCICGMPKRYSTLSNGWTVHRSLEPSSYGKLYYINDTTQQIVWELPYEVERQFSPEVRQMLIKLKREELR